MEQTHLRRSSPEGERHPLKRRQPPGFAKAGRPPGTPPPARNGEPSNRCRPCRES